MTNIKSSATVGIGVTHHGRKADLNFRIHACKMASRKREIYQTKPIKNAMFEPD